MSINAHLDDGALDALLDGGLDSGAERMARAHLASCAACRARYDQHALLWRALTGSLAREDEGVMRRVLAQTHPAPASAAPPKKRSPSLQAFAAIAAAACIALFVVIARPRVDDAVLSATVLHARGATIDGAPIADGALLYDGASFEVAANGLAELDLVRGGTLRVFPDTALFLEPRGEHVRLARGKVWAIVESERGPFMVTTEAGSARVLGTSFVVENKDRTTDVRVIEGKVEVRGAARETPVLVNGGERTRVSVGQRVEAPRRYDARDDRDQWQRFVDDLLRAVRRIADDALKALDPKHKR